MTKTQLVVEICKLDPSYIEKRGHLYYLCLDELIELYEELKNEKKLAKSIILN